MLLVFIPPSPCTELQEKHLEEGGRSNLAHLYRSVPLPPSAKGKEVKKKGHKHNVPFFILRAV